jgi:hypothetical protein
MPPPVERSMPICGRPVRYSPKLEERSSNLSKGHPKSNSAAFAKQVRIRRR